MLAFAQTNPAALAARAWCQQHEGAIVEDFFALLSISNVSRDRSNIRRNAEAIVGMMAKRGIAAKLVTLPDANPVVFGEVRTPGATRTTGVHAHHGGSRSWPRGSAGHARPRRRANPEVGMLRG